MAMDEPYELVQNGKPTGLTELPIEWILDDFPYYGGDASGSAPWNVRASLKPRIVRA
jgi:hypothetical protein